MAQETQTAPHPFDDPTPVTISAGSLYVLMCGASIAQGAFDGSDDARVSVIMSSSVIVPEAKRILRDQAGWTEDLLHREATGNHDVGAVTDRMAIVRLVAEVRRLRATMQAARNRHAETTDGFCVECHRPWRCHVTRLVNALEFGEVEVQSDFLYE